MGDNTNITKEITETLTDASKEVGLEVNAEKTKYMLLSRHQKAGKIPDLKIANKCFENFAQFRYLGTTVTNQNLIQEEIKKILNSGNACYHSIQNHLPSRLLSTNI
jgi:ribosomal protein S2